MKPSRAVRSRITDKSVALYVSSPSNPTGRVIPPDWLDAFAQLARRTRPVADLGRGVRGLRLPRRGVLARPRGHPSEPSRCSRSRRRTAWRATGWATSSVRARGSTRRTRWARTPPTMRRSPASSPRCARSRARTPGSTRRALPITRSAPPPRGRWAFPNPKARPSCSSMVSRQLDERGLPGFLEDCFEDGVLVAPGGSSGRDYASWIRLCYTAAPPDDGALRDRSARCPPRSLGVSLRSRERASSRSRRPPRTGARVHARRAGSGRGTSRTARSIPVRA